MGDKARVSTEKQAVITVAANQAPVPAKVQRKGGGIPSAGHSISKIRITPNSPEKAAELGKSGPAQPLRHLARIQKAFGDHDVRGVKEHLGPQAAAAASSIHAAAFTQKEHVAFRDTPDLFTETHEAMHVLQQRKGVSVQNGMGRTGDAYERQADAVARDVVAGQSVAPTLDRLFAGPSGGQHSVVQRRRIFDDVDYKDYLEKKPAEIAELKEKGLLDAQDIANINSLRANPQKPVPHPMQEVTEKDGLYYIGGNAYEKKEKLGGGAFGTAYVLELKEHKDNKEQKDVPKKLVIKIIDKESSPGDGEREIKTHAQLDDDNIAKFVAGHVGKDFTALVTEYLGGGQLTSMLVQLKRGYEGTTGLKRLNHTQYWGALQYLVRSLIKAVQHMSEKGLVHSDIAPKNAVLTDDQSEVKLIDMGLSVAKGGKQGGTPYFKAAYNKDGASTADDMLSIGRILQFQGESPKGKGIDEVHTQSNLVLQHLDAPPTLIRKETKANVQKEPNTYAYAGAYVDFVTRLNDEVPEKRPTPADALKHQFLSGQIISDDEAKTVLRGIPAKSETDEILKKEKDAQEAKEAQEAQKKAQEQEKKAQALASPNRPKYANNYSGDLEELYSAEDKIRMYLYENNDALAWSIIRIANALINFDLQHLAYHSSDLGTEKFDSEAAEKLYKERISTIIESIQKKHNVNEIKALDDKLGFDAKGNELESSDRERLLEKLKKALGGK